MVDLEPSYQAAIGLHRAGRLNEAGAAYRQILSVDPRFARAMHLLGVVLHQQGDSAAAVALIEGAIALEPKWPAFYSNLATVSISRLRAIKKEGKRGSSKKGVRPI